jgi:hypothetical protein
MSVDTLSGLGMVHMDEGEIRDFLLSQGTGVLGLPAADGPYMVPMSFGYDGGTELYFTYVLGTDSSKKRLSDEAGVARFLVYNARSPFTWQSVVLTGTIERVPEAESEAARAAMENAWHPDIFERAELDPGVELYRFSVQERVGLKHTGLPPGFERGE